MKESIPERDISFQSAENQARDIVLGFIHDKDDKRIGMRVLQRATNKVVPCSVRDDLRTWNLNINQGQFYPKCSKLSDFPVLSLPAGVEGNPLAPEAKLISKGSGAWVLEELGGGIFRLVSVSGQIKDVTEATALSFHRNYKIANATSNGDKLSGMYKQPKIEYGDDVFELFGDGRVHWISYNPDGNDGEGQYVENDFGITIIKAACRATSVGEFFDIIGSMSTQYLIDNDGGTEFEDFRKSVLTGNFNLVGCNEDTMEALKTFAGVEKDKFFLDYDTGRIEWIRRAKEGKRLFVVKFDADKTEALLKSNLSANDYFKLLATATLHTQGATSKVYGETMSEFSAVERRFQGAEYTMASATEKTKQALVEFGAKFQKDKDEESSKFFLVGEKLAKKGYVVLWVTRSEETGKVRYDLTYLLKDTILQLAEQKLGYIDFFDDGLHESSGCLYMGDDNFDKVDSLYTSDTAKWVGVSEDTMKGIIEYVQEASKTPKTPSKVKPDNSPDPADLEAMKALNEELRAASAAYYGDEESPLSDLEYDAKFDELLALEEKTGVILPDSVTQGVGTEVKGKLPKVQHAERLLSLDKTKAVDALAGLLKQDPNGGVGVLSWKMDGLTVLATYEGGVLKQAVTRGNGKIGEDVTHNAKFFKGMPRRIPYTGELRVRGEAVIAYSTFERINANLPEGQEPYKNPRNLASGMVRRSEVTKDGSVEFVPFGVVVTDPKFKPATYGQSLKFLTSQGFNPVFHVTRTADDVADGVEQFKKKIESFDYPTDGLVFAIDDLSVQDKLGSTGHHPRGAIAFKWADEKQKTTLRQIEWSASRTGVLTPVAIFDPVELEGTTVKRASVSNLTQLRKYKLGIGDTISVYKANMIIPQIAENHTGSDTVQAPKVCPVCGGATAIRKELNISVTKVEPSEFVVCTNPDCAAKNVGMLVHFAKRDAMNIDGISDKTVQELVSAGFIGKPADFYNLKNHPEIAELPKWGKTSYNKLLYAVDNSRAPRLANFIYALGIRNVGRSASDAIAKHFNSLDAFIGATAEQIGQVSGVGGGMTADIVAYLSKHADDVKSLASILTIINPDQEGGTKSVLIPEGVYKGAPDCLNGLVFCVTGKIEFPGARDALSTYIESLGGRMASSVSKTTNYLITNTPNSGSSKNTKAQALGCKVISEQSFFLLVKDLSEAIEAPELKDNERIAQEIAKTPEKVQSTQGEQTKPSMEELIAEFNKMYAMLYDSEDKVFGYSEALHEGDKYIKEHSDFVGEFVSNRGDFLSSDREVAAFMMAMKNLTTTQGEQMVQQGIDSVIIPEDPREARIQVAGAVQALTGLPLAGLTICVTGKVDYGTRAELHNFIESKGGKIASSVTRGVDYLITNTPFSGSSKNRSAQANGCHIISEPEFMAMVSSGKKPTDYNKVEKPEAPYESQVYETVKGKTFCITGRVTYPGVRAGLQAYIRSLGGYNADKVDYGVDYLITNDPFSGSTKNREARRIGCKIITEEQFLAMARNTR